MKKPSKRQATQTDSVLAAHESLTVHEEQTAQNYLAQREAERQAFERYTAEKVVQQESNRRVLQEARRKAIYGKEILGSDAGKRAVDLVEKLIETFALAKQLSSHAVGAGQAGADKKDRLLVILADYIVADTTPLPLEESYTLSPLERLACLMADFVRASYHSLKAESERFFQHYGAGCAKRRKPKQLHRAVIAGLLEEHRLALAEEELSRLATKRLSASDDESSVEPLDTDSLLRRFCGALKLPEATESERRSNYTSFMRTLKDMEEERLIPRVPRAKTGKKPKPESSGR